MVETDELFLNVSSLLSNTQYSIAVAAKLTSVCTGPYSSAITITTQPPGIVAPYDCNCLFASIFHVMSFCIQTSRDRPTR